MTYILIGQTVRRYREAQGMSQAELTRKAGIPSPTISRMENGKETNPTLSTIIRLANAFGVSLAEFLAGTLPACQHWTLEMTERENVAQCVTCKVAFSLTEMA